MITALIENYETLTVVGVFSIAVVWYLWHQTRAQTEREKKHDEQQLKREEKHDKIQEEDRKFHRNLITNDLKELHKDNDKNFNLNNQSLVLLKDVSKSQKDISENQTKLCKLIESVDRKINGKK